LASPAKGRCWGAVFYEYLTPRLLEVSADIADIWWANNEFVVKREDFPKHGFLAMTRGMTLSRGLLSDMMNRWKFKSG